MRSERSEIHSNLVFALAVGQIVFLAGIEATGNKVSTSSSVRERSHIMSAICSNF